MGYIPYECGTAEGVAKRHEYLVLRGEGGRFPGDGLCRVAGVIRILRLLLFLALKKTLSVFHTDPIITLKWLSSRFRSFLLPEEGFNLLLKLGPHYYD